MQMHLSEASFKQKKKILSVSLMIATPVFLSVQFVHPVEHLCEFYKLDMEANCSEAPDADARCRLPLLTVCLSVACHSTLLHGVVMTNDISPRTDNMNRVYVTRSLLPSCLFT